MGIDVGWIWGIAGLALLAAETVLPGFYLLWVGLAALIVCGAVVGFDIALTSQLVLFALSGLATCIAGWFVYHRGHAQTDDINDNAAQMVGSTGEVLEPGTGGQLRVKVRDSVWLAEGPHLAAGTRVRVVGQHGTVLKVKAAD